MNGAAVEDLFGTYHQSFVIDRDGVVQFITNGHNIPVNEIRWNIDNYLNITSVNENEQISIPTSINLLSGYPNPFNGQMNINVQAGISGPVTVSVYNLAGQLVGQLFNGHLIAGTPLNLQWSPQGPAGSYFIYMKGEGFSKTMRTLFLK